MKTNKLLKREMEKADRAAGYIFADPAGPYVNYDSYITDDLLVIRIGVDNPESDDMLCWTAIGQVRVVDGRLAYRFRVPQEERPHRETVGPAPRYIECPQDTAGMLRAMDLRREEFLRTGYLSLRNAATERAIEELE